MQHSMNSPFRQGVSRYGIAIILVGMFAAGFGYYLNPAIAKWIIIPTVTVVWLALLTKIVYQSARRQAR